MKIGEARQIYSVQLNKLKEQKRKLLEKQQKMKKNQNNTQEEYQEKNGVILELSDTLQKHIDKTQNFMNQLSILSNTIYNAEVTKQQGEAMSEYAEDTAKCMEIARRISTGGKVPYFDEKKLMKYNLKLYMAAKNIAMMNTEKSHKKYKSLWEEEEDIEKTESISSETADNREISSNIELPEITNLPEDFLSDMD